MELSPKYKAQWHRDVVRDSISLALKTQSASSLALLIDTAIESRWDAAEAEQKAHHSRRS